jgi:ferredoxin
MADTVNDLTTAIGRKQGAVEPEECCSIAIARLSNRSLISNVGTASSLSAGIDCGVCEPECPVDAIKADTEPGLEKWLSLNAEYAKIWPNITVKKAPPPDWKEWEGKSDKLQYFSPNPGEGN